MPVFSSMGKGITGLFKIFGGFIVQAFLKWKWTLGIISVISILWDAIKLAWIEKNVLVFLREIGIRSVRADAYIFDFLNKPLPVFSFNNLLEPSKLWLEFVGYLFLIAGMVWIYYKIVVWLNPHGTGPFNIFLSILVYSVISIIAGILTSSDPLGILNGVVLLAKSIPDILNKIGEFF